MLTKGWGSGWVPLSVRKKKLINDFIDNFELSEESNVGGKTDLFFFTEYDKIHRKIFKKNSLWKEMQT